MTPTRRDEHRGLRRAGLVVLVIVVALAGIGALFWYFTDQDSPTISAKGPGQEFADQGSEHVSPGERVDYNSDPPTSGPHVEEQTARDGTELSDDQILHLLEQGNVVLVYGDAQPPAALRRLAEEASGPYSRGLADAGQAVVLARRPGTEGVVALAWRHLLEVPSAGDPQLTDFIDYWLGQGADAS